MPCLKNSTKNSSQPNDRARFGATHSNKSKVFEDNTDVIRVENNSMAYDRRKGVETNEHIICEAVRGTRRNRS
jgi:hypothetical protein